MVFTDVSNNENCNCFLVIDTFLTILKERVETYFSLCLIINSNNHLNTVADTMVKFSYVDTKTSHDIKYYIRYDTWLYKLYLKIKTQKR